MITVLLRLDHHVDHTFVEATHYRDEDGVLTVHRDGDEIARFPIGSWDGVYRHVRSRVREQDGSARPAKALEVDASG